MVPRLWPARWQQNPQNVISGFGSFGGVPKVYSENRKANFLIPLVVLLVLRTNGSRWNGNNSKTDKFEMRSQREYGSI